MSVSLQKLVTSVAALTSAGNAELFVAYSGQLRATFQTVRAIAKGWAQITFSAATTGVILRLRRGNGLAGAVAAGGTTQAATASVTQNFSLWFSEQLINADFADYTFSIQSVAGGANCTVVLGQLETETING